MYPVKTEQSFPQRGREQYVHNVAIRRNPTNLPLTGTKLTSYKGACSQPVCFVPMQLGPVSWAFDKNALAGSGYSIEPDKVVRLPEGASAAFSASFQAR